MARAVIGGTVALLTALCLSGCAAFGTAGAQTSTASAASSGPPAPSASPSPSSPSPSSPSSPSLSASASPAVRSADALAGLRSHTVTWTGGGTLVTVPGTTRGTGSGKLIRVRVEVEKGLDVDRAAFAAFVLATLHDDRSWSHDGAYRFARTDGASDIRVVLASPATSARMCRPLQTFGKLSCGSGTTAVLTMYRWVRTIPEYQGDPTGYRHYVVNHEVGHTLGHGHQYCAGPGKVAPAMMQQTKGLHGCRPNPWPYP